MDALSRVGDEAVAQQLVHDIIDGVCRKAHPQYAQYAKSLSVEDFDRLCASFKQLITTSDDYAPSNDALKSAGLNDTAAALASTCIKAREADLEDAARRDAHAVGSAAVRDFDWNVALAIGGDRFNSIRQAFCSLRLDPATDSDDALEVELSRKEMDSFVEQLTQAEQLLNTIA